MLEIKISVTIKLPEVNQHSIKTEDSTIRSNFVLPENNKVVLGFNLTSSNLFTKVLAFLLQLQKTKTFYMYVK